MKLSIVMPVYNERLKVKKIAQGSIPGFLLPSDTRTGLISAGRPSAEGRLR